MNKRFFISICLVLVISIILSGAGYLLLSRPASVAPSSESTAFDAMRAASATTSASVAPAPRVQPPHTERYQSALYQFSFYYPDDLVVSEHQVGGNSTVIVLKDSANGKGFQIFVTPYNEPKITSQRFQMDEPSGIMKEPQNITIDGVPATKFASMNTAMGNSSEIWLLRKGFLYEITAPQTLDSWLMQIMQTWQFSSAEGNSSMTL